MTAPKHSHLIIAVAALAAIGGFGGGGNPEVARAVRRQDERKAKLARAPKMLALAEAKRERRRQRNLRIAGDA